MFDFDMWLCKLAKATSSDDVSEIAYKIRREFDNGRMKPIMYCRLRKVIHLAYLLNMYREISIVNVDEKEALY